MFVYQILINFIFEFKILFYFYFFNEINFYVIILIFNQFIFASK